MGNARAYTFVDRGKALVGNRWLERTWSAFLGNTTGLVQKADGFEWVAGRAAEYRVEVDGEARGVMDFGETSWSEENSAQGATLVSVQNGPGLDVTVRTVAYHDHPALLRTLALRNRGDKPVAIGRVTTESLALEHAGLEIRTHGFQQAHNAIEWETEEPAAAVGLTGRGLIFGQRGEGLFQLGAPEPGVFAATCAGSRALAAGESLQLPATFLIPYTGPLQEAVDTLLPNFLLRHLP